MAAGFLELIQSDLNSVDLKVEKVFKIKPGHLNRFAHVDIDELNKQLRPALVLLSGRIFKCNDEKLVYLAAVIQLVYLASGIHFGIPENSNRRGLGDPRDAAQFPVLVGDYLYGQFFVVLGQGEILEFLTPLADIIAEMNYGALLRKRDFEEQGNELKVNLTVIEKETALLMEGAVRMAGIIAKAPADQLQSLADFGRNFGMAYGILERRQDREMAEPYFAAAWESLQGLPAGEARDTLKDLQKKIQQGEKVIEPIRIGSSEISEPRQIGDVIIPEQFKGKEEYVHSIFSSIAGKYDFLNTVLSLNQDKHWRKITVEQTGLKSGESVLDVCCGTGMISVELAKRVGPEGKVTGLDFNEAMLDIARANLQSSPYKGNIEYIQGNAMELPFDDNSFDSVTIGFGLRNVPDRKKTLSELMRVVKPGGRVVCLEFSKPTVPMFKQLYNFYFDKLVPLLGRLGVGMEGPYRYLHSSWKVFPHQKELREEFSRQGLVDAAYKELTGGVVSVHVGTKPLENTLPSVAATSE